MRRFASWFVMLTAGAALLAAEKTEPFRWRDPAFQFGSRRFSREEAKKIIALAPEPPRTEAEARKFVVSQRLLLTGIVLCEEQGAALSEAETLKDLRLELLAMPPEVRREFARTCRALRLQPEELLRQEAGRLDRQFQCAVREWYRRVYPHERISDIQVRDWYFRHQERFLTREIKDDAWWLLPPGEENARRAAALLKQGVPSAAVQKKFPVAAEDAAVEQAWERPAKQDFPEKGFVLYPGETFQILARGDAVKFAYRPLTTELAEAIRNALYDALAKARFAEALKNRENRMEFRFF